ncbi:hypothetical protein Taro_022295 [Colocasia esculenta]|uniref:Uncharacterized protein n=1 Tax=Colocasia esculenta TaxID=4460 RepID=A0A843V7I2_COLES|nr:hypothetical protein [Colocasia esculenta]
MQAPPPRKVCKNQEAGGKIPSFVEFLALREQSESSHAPQMSRERIDLDPSNPISEVPNETRSNNKTECGSKSLANIPRIPADNPAMVALSQKYQLEIEMLRKQIQEKEAYILASKEMEGLVEALQCDINPSQTLPTVPQSMPAHTGGILLTHPYQMTPEQPEVYSTIGQEFTIKSQVERVSIQPAHIRPSLADPALVNSLMKLMGMSGSITATPHDSAAPCPPVHDMHYNEAMRNVTRGPTVYRSLSSRCTYSNHPVKSMADRLSRQGVLEAGPYMSEEVILATKLHAISQRGGELARDYIRQWMNFCRKCKQPLCEEDAVNICKNNLQKEILNRMGGIDIRTFDRLNNVATDIEAFLTKYYSADTAGQRKRHVQILEAAEGEASSSLDKLSRRRKIIPLKEKMQKPYSFPRDKTWVLFEWAQRHNKLVPPEPRRTDDFKKKDDPRFCLYHQLPGHVTEDYYVLKDQIESLIRKGELQVGEYRPRTCMAEATTSASPSHDLKMRPAWRLRAPAMAAHAKPSRAGKT